jgi:nucleotide-binding universal stress UspA family protein
MYKRIMVAVDESFMTSQVMKAAVELAKSTGAQMAICHAIDETILAQREVAMMLPNSVGKTEARMRLGAQGFLGRLAETARAAGIEVEIRLVESEQKHVSDMLIDAATRMAGRSADRRHAWATWHRAFLCRQRRRAPGAQEPDFAAAGARRRAGRMSDRRFPGSARSLAGPGAPALLNKC